VIRRLGSRTYDGGGTLVEELLFQGSTSATIAVVGYSNSISTQVGATVNATAHDGLPASQSLLARAHIFATYLPGMAHVVASQESCRNPQVEVIQTLPSQTI
jgi:hypothetical protein